MSRILPRDPDFRPTWEGYAAGELRLTRCTDCGRLRWPARAICNACASERSEQIVASGNASVASWTVTHHRFVPDEDVPYTVVLARLDEQEDILVPGDFAGPADGTGLAIGVRLIAEFAPVVDGDLRGGIVRWRIVD